MSTKPKTWKELVQSLLLEVDVAHLLTPYLVASNLLKMYNSTFGTDFTLNQFEVKDLEQYVLQISTKDSLRLGHFKSILDKIKKAKMDILLPLIEDDSIEDFNGENLVDLDSLKTINVLIKIMQSDLYPIDNEVYMILEKHLMDVVDDICLEYKNKAIESKEDEQNP